ncbi:MAG: type II secretion system protein, partial [Rhodospirillaceae bacterium]
MAFTRNQACTRPARRQGGFTLIEMSIAVAIFGLLASGAIMATSAWLGKQALDKTAKNLDKIESALTLYVVQNGAL